jgi:Xaa-Pro aminopeptidase
MQNWIDIHPSHTRRAANTMNQPPPQIPAAEYPQRWRAVQDLLDRTDVDLLLAYADDRAVFGPAHARWLANFPVHFEPVCVVLARTGAPVLLCGPETDQYALLAGRIPDVRVLREFTHPDEDYPYSRIQSLADMIAELVGAPDRLRRVGIAGRGLIGFDFYTALQQALPGVAWVYLETALCSLRARKSPAEQAVIRHAYRIAEQGFAAAVAAIVPGVTEREVAAEAEAAMRRAGAEGTGIDTIVAAGPHARPILARSTFRPIAAADVVLLTLAPRYEGYHAAIGRPVFVGAPDPQVARALDVAVEAQEACFAALRPGVEGRQVEAVGRRIVEQAGLGEYFLYSGVHSVGVIEFEPPIFGPSSGAVIAPDMVISVDIPLFNAPWGGLRVEDGYLVTAAGAERLHHTPYRIQR